MTDSSQTQDNNSSGEKHNPPAPHVISDPSADPITADTKFEVITDKFLAVAKEKSNLESVIMSQHDIIKGLEREKEKLILSLKKFSASHKSMKGKLLDFDILRNMEISELKKKIEHLIADNKKLISDKDSIIRNLKRKQDNISRADNQVTGLNTDIDGLTPEIESKIHVIEELNSKVVSLSAELSRKDSQLYEKIPALQQRINSLSGSIDRNMEENSLFVKELFDLHAKISTLNKEMIEKDELLIDIAEDFKNQKDEIEALHSAHELTLRNLVYERNLLKKESEDLRSIAAIPQQQFEHEQKEKKVLEDRLSETLKAIDESGRENAGLAALIAEKDAVINDLQRDVLVMGSRLEEAEEKHAESLAALQEQFSILNQQLLEKNEMLNALTTEHSQAPEKDLAIAELQKELLLHQSKLEEATAEHAERLSAMQEKIVLLNQQLLEKNELLTVMASEREHEKNALLYQTDLLRKEKDNLDEEMNRLMARGLERETILAEHISLFDVSQKEKTGLEDDLAQAAEKINELVLEQDRLAALNARQEESLSDARTEINLLQASHAELEKKLAEKQEMSGLASAVNEEFQKTTLEYQTTFEHLKQEIISLNKNLAEKEQTINLLLSEKDALAGNISDQQEKLDQSLSSIQSLQMQLDESRHDNNRFSAEKSDLANTIAGLQGEINVLSRTREEEVAALQDDLSSYGRALADLRLKLEQGLSENAELRSELQASQNAGLEAPKPFIQKREETLPARVKKRPSASRRSLAYTLIALLFVGGVGFSFYAFNTGLISVPVQKPAAREEVKKELDYADMFSMLTKVSASDDFKFQATLLTESLVLKSDIPGEKSLFDFQNHIYFKVSISAPRGGLDHEMADDPYPMITLTAGTDMVKPLSHIHVKDIKIFYRKEEPVSIMFYSAFPRTALTSDRNALSLSFKNEKGKADLAWDLQSLRANNLSP